MTKAEQQNYIQNLCAEAIAFYFSEKGGEEIECLKKRFASLREIMPQDHPGDMSWSEWVQLYTLTKTYNPDFVLELGRGYGNSTLIFDSALPDDVPFVSLCLNDFGPTESKLKNKNITFRKKTFLKTENIVGYPFQADRDLLFSKKCLLFWDAHGFEVAEEALSGVLPYLTGQTLVLAHDIGDLRYQPDQRDYHGEAIWKAEPEKWPGPSIVLGNFFAHVAQLVSILDFTSRNQIFFNSLNDNFNKAFDADGRQQRIANQGREFPFSSGIGSFLVRKNEILTFPAKNPEKEMTTQSPESGKIITNQTNKKRSFFGRIFRT